MAARAHNGEQAMAELVEAIGEDAARQLARAFGGTVVYVPRTIGDAHPLCAAIGRDAADRLSAWAATSSLTIPKQPERRAQVRELHRQGNLTIKQIALQTGYSVRQVYRLLDNAGDECQLNLFG